MAESPYYTFAKYMKQKYFENEQFEMSWHRCYI